jgi:hypothetical protein
MAVIEREVGGRGGKNIHARVTIRGRNGRVVGIVADAKAAGTKEFIGRTKTEEAHGIVVPQAAEPEDAGGEAQKEREEGGGPQKEPPGFSDDFHGSNTQPWTEGSMRNDRSAAQMISS